MNKLLIEALKNAFDMEQDDAIGLAKTVETIFNGQKEIEDMTIDKYARSLFYELQRQNLLKIRREEMREQGKAMRKFYWSLDKQRIKQEARRKQQKNMYKIYQEIPSNAWHHRLNNA
jgi:chromatin segregation and condensation protein Rec8/ScpA/Scc1 (kleisin family)